MPLIATFLFRNLVVKWRLGAKIVLKISAFLPGRDGGKSYPTGRMYLKHAHVSKRSDDVLMIHSKRIKTIFASILVCAFFLQASSPSVFASDIAGTDEDKTEETSADNVIQSFSEQEKYSEYISKYKNAKTPAEEYVIEAGDYTALNGMQIQKNENYENLAGTSILTGESGWVEWTVNIRQAGLYNISLEYYPVEGKSSDIQRTIYIDGKLPFEEAMSVEFCRQWTDETQDFEKDNQGNELRPKQVEAPEWSETFVKDSSGYYDDPFQFYFSAGKHTIRLISQREPMMLRCLKICQELESPSYSEVSKEYTEKGYQKATGGTVIIQAEKAYKTSSPTLYPLSDRSSPSIEPSSEGKTRLNSIGGSNWNQAGEWIEWKVSVPESGLYQIGMNVKQNWMQGFYVPRKLTIDGKVPFKEMKEIHFDYRSGWRQQVLGGDTPYLFYFSKGEHLLRLEVVMGKAASMIRNVKTSITNLNSIYQQIIMLTGEDTDKWRDYQIEKNIPGLAKKIKTEYDRLTKVANDIEGLTGSRSDKESIILTLTQQLKKFYDDVEKIPSQKNSLKTNIGALGTWLTEVESMPIQLDAIYLMPPSNQLPKVNNSFWNNLVFQVKLLINSFTTDYNAVGNVTTDKNAKSITVWVGTGRDQADSIKSLIDESFTKESGINVNLMLVQMGTLLQATLAGQGPDVAMQVSNDIPMNYAMRGAAIDLSQFSDFQTVASRFRSSALVPFQFRNKTYALPETQTFNMMFYRKDILKKLGLGIPQTWDDVKADISVLSKNHMEFGMLPLNTAQQGSSGASADLSYGMFLYQYGGKFYKEDGKSSALDSDVAVNAFKEWVKYYQDYTLTREFDLQNRFRTGEAPLIISDYTLYNTLQVAAPEIKGLWGFTQVPGSQKEDGTIDHSVASTGLATIIMQNAKDKQSAWEFLKWWTSSDVQTKYGMEMEALQGASARYPTANIEALKKLPWSTQDYKSLSQAFESVRGIPQVPGSYYNARDIQNAFSTVVIDHTEDAREALMDNVKYLNDEITSKRKEFHLDS